MVLPVADASSGDAKSMGRIGQTWDLSVWNHIYAAGRAVQVHRVNVMSMITVRFPNSSKAHWMERAGCGNMGEKNPEKWRACPHEGCCILVSPVDMYALASSHLLVVSSRCQLGRFFLFFCGDVAICDSDLSFGLLVCAVVFLHLHQTEACLFVFQISHLLRS